MFGIRKWMKSWCSCDAIQIYVNSKLYLLISHQAIIFCELDEYHNFYFKKAGNK